MMLRLLLFSLASPMAAIRVITAFTGSEVLKNADGQPQGCSRARFQLKNSITAHDLAQKTYYDNSAPTTVANDKLILMFRAWLPTSIERKGSPIMSNSSHPAQSMNRVAIILLIFLLNIVGLVPLCACSPLFVDSGSSNSSSSTGYEVFMTYTSALPSNATNTKDVPHIKQFCKQDIASMVLCGFSGKTITFIYTDLRTGKQYTMSRYAGFDLYCGAMSGIEIRQFPFSDYKIDTLVNGNLVASYIFSVVDCGEGLR